MEQHKKYKPSSFEVSWRKKWEEQQLYNVDNKLHADKPTYYCLDMFPYPSGSGLHVGHWRGYVLSDVWSRYKVLSGYNVLHPMGWDNFGLPAETDAIKKGIHPKISTRKNIDNMRRQLKEIGCIYDWNREVTTSDPDYYRWTQWIFLQLYKKKLAYQKKQPVNWCDDCKVVLANEEVDGGKCERCGGPSIRKIFKNQWMLKITEYAERLLKDLDELDWPSKVKEMQKNWIGRSEGATVTFTVASPKKDENFNIDVFTTRPDTLFGATFMVLAPEHPMALELSTSDRKSDVETYIKNSQTLSNIDRQKQDREKTGVFTGSYALNPVNDKKIPVWVADYVLMDYGTGSIMAVPAHDERDFEFATKYSIPVIEVIESGEANKDSSGNLTQAYIGDGKLVNSDFINGLNVSDAKKKVISFLEDKSKGKSTITYKLRDWIFARQRYWGEPIPIIHCEKCGTVAVPEKDLPVMLPDIEAYQPTGSAESPLAAISEWVNTKCPECGGDAKRETDTMPQWAGSSWYFVRYASPYFSEAIADPAAIKKWLPVDMYVGGIEHAVLHLLYARFWTKVLYDCGVLEFNEPFKRLFNQGMICRVAYRCPVEKKWVSSDELGNEFGKDNVVCPHDGSTLEKTMEKMSKSKGNGVSPDELVEKYGTDSVRLYELFTGDPTLDSEWNDDGIKGCYSFLQKTWYFVAESNLVDKPSKKAMQLVHRLNKKIVDRLETFKFNTAISAFMEFINEAKNMDNSFSKDLIEHYLILLAPFAPHICEELWQSILLNNSSIFLAKWPGYDESLTKLSEIEIVVQINGKIKDTFITDMDSDNEKLQSEAKQLEKIAELLEGKSIVKTIVVPNKLVNLVVK